MLVSMIRPVPLTFGEIPYMQLNQTPVHLTIESG
jgi:hypothetical protein